MATKKSFKGNPALQFISSSQEAAEQAAALPTEDQQPEKIKGTIPPAPKGYKINPLYLETKSQRVQVVMQPSLLKLLKKQAKEQKLSTNGYIHIILEAAARKYEYEKEKGEV